MQQKTIFYRIYENLFNTVVNLNSMAIYLSRKIRIRLCFVRHSNLFEIHQKCAAELK